METKDQQDRQDWQTLHPTDAGHGTRVHHSKPAFVRDLERSGKVEFTPPGTPNPWWENE